MRKTLVLAWIVAGVPATALAQVPAAAPLTLSAAIERAQTSNFDVRLAQADVDASLARVAAARASLLPSVGASATTMNGGIAQLGMPIAQQTYLSLSVAVPLYVPAAARTATSQAFVSQAAVFDAHRVADDAVLLATQAYERVLLADAVLSSRVLTVDYQERRTAYVTLRVRTGASPRYERSQAQAALAMARRSLEDAAAERDESRADLEVILDLPIDPTLLLADVLEPLSISTSFDAVRTRALARRPEVLAARAQADAAAARVAAARSRYAPTVVANAQTYTGRSQPDLGTHGYQIGIVGSLPLVDGGARSADLREMEADARRVEILVERARRSVERDVANAWREYLAAHTDLGLARIQAVAATDELRVATLRERTGKGIALETLAALAGDGQAREDALRATARLNDAIAAVYHAESTTITSKGTP